jgi:hypothetical protein
MAGLIASKDWSKTALGDRNDWSPNLKLIVGIMTASGFPMAVRWGPEFILIYNDGYRSILADKHPWALGLPFRVVWPEVVPELIPLQEAILAVESPGVYSEDRPLTIRRRDLSWETAHFTVSYSPVPDPASPTAASGSVQPNLGCMSPRRKSFTSWAVCSPVDYRTSSCGRFRYFISISRITARLKSVLLSL